jgi:hypothetical protein
MVVRDGPSLGLPRLQEPAPRTTRHERVLWVVSGGCDDSRTRWEGCVMGRLIPTTALKCSSFECDKKAAFYEDMGWDGMWFYCDNHAGQATTQKGQDGDA